ncbi:MAG: hypothetical protein RQ824_02455 [bacterium]|nr:hypothetical protein [bacterium]
MAKCLSCGNTTNFNVWCKISRVLEVELDEFENVRAVIGEPEDEELQGQEEYFILDDDLELSMVSCAWCGSNNILLEDTIHPATKNH